MDRPGAGAEGPGERRPRVSAETLYALLIVLLLGGLSAASFAAYEVVNPAAAQFCSPDPFLSCSRVLDSGHTNIGGIPDWSIGIVGYLAMLVLAVLASRTYDWRYLTGVMLLSLGGLAISLLLVYTELVVVGAICPVCTTAHLLNVGVLATSVALLRMSRPEADALAPPSRPAASGDGRPGGDRPTPE